MRRERIVEINDPESRDHGKKFKITEMSPWKGEKWALRVLLAVAATDAEVNFQAPMAQIAEQGFKGLFKVEFEKAEALLDELMTCVEVIIPAGGTRKLMEEDIEEIMTIGSLQWKTIELHTGFSLSGDNPT